MWYKSVENVSGVSFLGGMLVDFYQKIAIIIPICFPMISDAPELNNIPHLICYYAIYEAIRL